MDPCAVPRASTILVPELQHWFNLFVVGSEINKNFVPFPVDVPELYLTRNSFISLLFNDSYSESTYEYRYKQETNKLCWPRVVLTRIQVYPSSSKYLIVDRTGDNVFNLKQDDFTLLDALLAYRLDSTSVTIVDTTGVAYFDSTADILYARYDSLSTKLSKLIYLYLDLKIYSNFQNYNNLFLLSTGTLLDSCYEAYVIDAYFEFMTKRVPALINTPTYGGPGTCLP